jgi:hypothetical protein
MICSTMPSAKYSPLAKFPTVIWWDSSPKIKFAPDSLLEGAGFEPSVPLEVLTVGVVPCRLRGPFHASLPKTKFAAYSTALAPSGVKTQRAILAVGTGHGRRARGGAGDGFRCARPHAEAAGARQFASPNRSFALNRGRSEPVNCEPEGFALHLC